jgi:hypothetical protein
MFDDEFEDEELPPMPTWDIRIEGRRWTWDEWEVRCLVMPEKLELIEGKLFWSDRERIAMLGSVLEMVGLAEAVKLAPRELWLQALGQMEE